MDWTSLNAWMTRTDLVVLGVLLFVAMGLAAVAGVALSRLHSRTASTSKDQDGGQGYIVSAVLGLLALLMGFTFSLAVERFDARRVLVLEEANAIGTAYLRAQLLSEPHRKRMSDLLVRYTENRLALSGASPGSADQISLLRVNDALVTDIWAATSASFDSIKGLDFSSAYLGSINAVIDLDASRKAARGARVPDEVFAVLFVYLITTAGVLGYVLKGAKGFWATAHLLALLTLCLMLIIDINRPVRGGVSESQGPMIALRDSLKISAAEYDKWRAKPAP